MKRSALRLSLLLTFLLTTILDAQIIEFDLQGKVEGISGQNENPPISGAGTGDINVDRIFFDSQTRILTVDIHWGSANGFTDLSSDVDFMNLHGPTESDAPASFDQNADVLTGLNGFSSSASSGGFSGAIDIPTEEVQNLLNGRYYIHLHTFDEPDGECRGYVVPSVNRTQAFNVFRGVAAGGELEDVLDSDDSYISFRPGFTLSSTEAPVWLEFDGALLSQISVLFTNIESSVNTPGLTQTIEMFDWSDGGYSVVDATDASFNTDTVFSIDVSSGIADFIRPDTNLVRTRVGWRRTGFTILFPWEVRVDQVTWSTTD